MTALTYYAAAATACVFFILKVCEERFFSKSKPFKINRVLKSSVFVYISSLIGAALMGAVADCPLAGRAPSAFLDKPAF